jgi:hypothetical protein
MPDLLIRGLDEDEVAQLDARAERLGISRNEYVRRRLSEDARAGHARVTLEDLERLARTFDDATDEGLMADAWH